MMEFLAMIPHEVGMGIATWASLIAMLALGAAGFLNVAKENDNGLDV